MNTLPAISLPLFAGPLDLLLELVRRNQLDITDIPIADITRQYLDYMHQAAQLDIDLGAEFTYMAATLIQLKSRSLLPADPELTRREPDSRQELIRQLLDHAQVQQAAEFLQQKLDISSATWTKPAPAEFHETDGETEDVQAANGSMNLLELVRLAKGALETARTHELLQFQREEVSIDEMISWLQPRLAALSPEASLPFDPLFEEQPDGRHRIGLFLAVLELSKTGAVALHQKDTFEPIHLTITLAYGTTVP
jgi:segregation and condensation protein A